MSKVFLKLGKLHKTVGRLSVQWPALERIADHGTLHLPSVERLPRHWDEEPGRTFSMVEPLKTTAAARLLPHVVEDLCRTASRRLW